MMKSYGNINNIVQFTKFVGNKKQTTPNAYGLVLKHFSIALIKQTALCSEHYTCVVITTLMRNMLDV